MLTRVLAALAAVTAPAAAAIELQWPVACALGADCFIQQMVDHDPGPGAADHACGAASYDGHDGTDIRVVTTADAARGVAVLAAHGGVVKAIRDGEPDRLARTEADKGAVANKECGNGVVLDGGGGWVSQYCHLKRGSIAVKPGDELQAGQRLGDVGYSGLAAFPHLHMTLRHNKRVADPFDGTWQSDGCAETSSGMWASSIQGLTDYQATALLGLGIAPGAVDLAALESGETQSVGVDAASPALVGWLWAINLEKGDILSVTLDGPDGRLAENSESMPRNKAQYLLFSGKKRKTEAWPAGTYRVLVTVTRGGKTILERASEAKF